MWTRNLDTSAASGDSRNLFITFIVANGLCILFFFLTFSTKAIENLLRTGFTTNGVTFDDESIELREIDGDLQTRVAMQECAVLSQPDS